MDPRRTLKIRFQNHLAKFVNWDNDNFDYNAKPSVSVEDDYGRQVLKSSNFDSIDENFPEEPPF